MNIKLLTKYIGLTVCFSSAMLLTSGCGKNKEQISVSDEIIKSNTTEYETGDFVYHPSEDTIAIDSDSDLLYYKNLINVFLYTEITDSEKEELAEKVNGKIVSSISSGTNIIQIMVPDFELDEWNQLHDEILESGFAFAVELECPQDITEAKKNNTNSSNSDWWIQAINMEEAWKYADYAQDYCVGICDAGFELSNAAFQRNGETKITMVNTNTPHSHGTRVAGLIAAENGNRHNIRGVADKSTLFCADIVPFDENNPENETLISSTEIINSMNLIMQHGVKVINNSWGTQLEDSDHYQDHSYTQQLSEKKNCSVSDITYEQYCTAIKENVEESSRSYLAYVTSLMLQDKDFIIVQAAGNGYKTSHIGYEIKFDQFLRGITKDFFEDWVSRNYNLNPQRFNEDPFAAHNISYETFCDHRIIVGAVKDETDDQARYRVCNFSNYGETVDIVAPGNNIKSSITGDTVGSDSGTSFATPMVSGAAAYLWELRPDLSSKDIKDALVNKSKRAIGVTDSDAGKEYPMLDVGAAITGSVMGTIHISVADSDTNEKIDNISWTSNCSITDNPIFNVSSTSEDGEIYCTSVGDMTITISKEGYVDYILQQNVAFGEELDLGTIYLEKTPQRNDIDYRDRMTGLWLAEDSEHSKSYYLEFGADNSIYYRQMNSPLNNGCLPLEEDSFAAYGNYEYIYGNEEEICKIHMENLPLADAYPTPFMTEDWLIDVSEGEKLVIYKENNEFILMADEVLTFYPAVKVASGIYLKGQEPIYSPETDLNEAMRLLSQNRWYLKSSAYSNIYCTFDNSAMYFYDRQTETLAEYWEPVNITDRYLSDGYLYIKTEDGDWKFPFDGYSIGTGVHLTGGWRDLTSEDIWA